MSNYAGLDTRRFCDVVMKGGVTSGVVYPSAICKLATTYILKNIGGTSVGAIAASVTAAAEYRRRQSGTGAGYDELAKLPGFLGRHGTLRALFAADPKARTLLEIALIPIGNASALTKTLQVILALFIWYLWIPVLTVGITFGGFLWAASPVTPLALARLLGVSILFGVIAALVFIAIWFVIRVVAVLDGNSFGWCHGYSSKAEAQLAAVTDVTTLTARQTPPLFNWLEAFVAQAAGRPASAPLTFGDLWNAPFPPWYTPDADERSIDFRMVTTCLTLGRPYALPFNPDNCISQVRDTATDVDEDGKRRPSIYFRQEDLAAFFSESIVNHMMQFGKKTELVSNDTYYRFPAADKVPIVVATRLSMSFPVLFCAVPLYAIDETGAMQRIWFSDGGLTSNFPIQFFDNPLPRWPTFAIDLVGGAPSSGTNATGKAQAHFGMQTEFAKYVPGAVFIESEAPAGTVNPWDRIDRGDARGKVLAFASSILDAARTWQDVTLGSLPGNASRIVAIRLTDDQGGLNLNMPPQTITTMTALGTQAGEKLLSVFADDVPDAQGWQRHRWIRYRAIMGAISRLFGGFKTGYPPFNELPSQETYAQLITQLPPEKQPDVLAATQAIASAPIVETFFEIEETPIAVLPTRPDV